MSTQERVIAHNVEVGRQAFEQPCTGMKNPAAVAVHRLRRMFDRAAKHLGNSLVPQANSQHRDRGLGDDVCTYTKIVVVLRVPWPGGKHDGIVSARIQRVIITGIRNYHWLRSSHLIEVLRDVPGKRVEIVDEQNFHFTCPCARERAISASSWRQVSSMIKLNNDAA
ncbi:hypothetical protein D3C85_1088820 [compost metagenome]